jgi:hypothetical protein
MSPCIHVSMSPCLYVHVSMFLEFWTWKKELTENGNFRLFSGKLPFVCCKRTFVFLSTCAYLLSPGKRLAYFDLNLGGIVRPRGVWLPGEQTGKREASHHAVVITEKLQPLI